MADTQQEFQQGLIEDGICAETSLDGIASPGVNRFPNFIEQIRKGYIKVQAEPERIAATGAWVRYVIRVGLISPDK